MFDDAKEQAVAVVSVDLQPVHWMHFKALETLMQAKNFNKCQL